MPEVYFAQTSALRSSSLGVEFETGFVGSGWEA